MELHDNDWVITGIYIISIQIVSIVIYSFTANGPHQLSLSIGTIVKMEEQNSGWYKGHEYTKPNEKVLLISPFTLLYS